MESRKQRFAKYRLDISRMPDDTAPDYVDPQAFKKEEMVNQSKSKAVSGNASVKSQPSPYSLYRKKKVTSFLIRLGLSFLILLGLGVWLFLLLK